MNLPIAVSDLIEAQNSFVAKDAFADADGNINTAMPQSTWHANFKSMDEHSLVEFNIQYDDLAQLEATINMGFKEGLTMAMENLDELLASQTNQ